MFNGTKKLSLFKIINVVDVSAIGLKIFDQQDDENCQYIQICDTDDVFNDKKYACHYEILFMKEDDFEAGHKKEKVYVEIHFENKKYSKCFEYLFPIFKKLNLSTFDWTYVFLGFRLNNEGFLLRQKKEILKNLNQLKELTLDLLLSTYRDVKFNRKWEPSFDIYCKSRKTSKTRALNSFERDAKEIPVIHEVIKDNLIKEICSNPRLLNKVDPIKKDFLSPEHEVNKINYIDLFAMTEKGKRVFFEIKTSQDARLCIRQALAQLMEYAYFPNVTNADVLVVVGCGEETDYVTTYLEK